MDHLIDTLQKSVEKNGEQPLTNKWLLSLLKIAREKAHNEEIPLWEWCSSEDIY